MFFVEIQRILKVGGRCKIIVPHYKHSWAYSNFGHRGFYSKDAIDNVCSADGNVLVVPFKLISSNINYSRFRFWIPKEIIWVIEKILIRGEKRKCQKENQR